MTKGLSPTPPVPGSRASGPKPDGSWRRRPPFPERCLAFAALLALGGCGKTLPACLPSSAASSERAAAAMAPQSPQAAAPPPATAPATGPVSATAPATAPAAKEILIGIDGSGSMQGHGLAADPSAWRRLLQSVNLSAQTLTLQARAFRVGGGTAVALPSSSATTANNPCFFKGCAPFTPVASSLHTLWSLPARGSSPPLRLLISDLEVNQSDSSALIGSIKPDLAKGAAAGILALRLPFTGQVFDAQAQPLFKGSLNRPVYLLATGPAEQVRALLEEIRKIMAQKGVRSQELSLLNPQAGAKPLTAKAAMPIPPANGSVGLPLSLSGGRYTPPNNSDYRFIKLSPGATGLSVMTLSPWSGGSKRPDLGLVRLERIPLSPEESASPGDISIEQMVVAGSQIRLDLNVPPTTPSGALRATIPVLPQQWWIDWDRQEAKASKASEQTDGLLLLLTTLESQIREARGAPPAATLCLAFHLSP
jgi:hypothetical protein